MNHLSEKKLEDKKVCITYSPPPLPHLRYAPPTKAETIS